MKPEVIQETGEHHRRSYPCAMVRHGQILESMRRFQETYPFMVSTVSQLPPFYATLHWPAEVDGVAMDHYIACMKSAYWITTTFRPAILVPAGFTPDGLPRELPDRWTLSRRLRCTAAG